MFTLPVERFLGRIWVLDDVKTDNLQASGLVDYLFFL